MGPLSNAAAIAQTLQKNVEELSVRYRATRRQTQALCAPLATEDHCVQTTADVSPPKWHLAHTTWFFETFLLRAYNRHYQVFHPGFDHLFNSYYETVGTPFPRAQRGLLSRPTVADIYRYRAHVDSAMMALIAEAPTNSISEIVSRTALGLHHEEQHQELLLTDIKHIFAVNPLRPIYQDTSPVAHARAAPLQWMAYSGGVRSIGHDGTGFAFDNETPRHRVYVQDFVLASRLVTNREYLDFMNDRGYARPELWLADGWRCVKEQGWRAPLYWEDREGAWSYMTLHGMRALVDDEPVCHVSFYEADAYARWAGKRLASESEWELAAGDEELTGNFRETGILHPAPARADSRQLFGDVWEWTQSSYAPYPGFRAVAGALGEYNGKFMCNQMVLRGGSCVTPRDHIRVTYRNFFFPTARWQFSGIRLAADR